MLLVATAATDTPEKTTLHSFFSALSLFIVWQLQVVNSGKPAEDRPFLSRWCILQTLTRDQCFIVEGSVTTDELFILFLKIQRSLFHPFPVTQGARGGSTPWTGPYHSGTASGTRCSAPKTLIRPLPPQILIRLGTQRMQWNRRCMFLAHRHQKTAVLHYVHISRPCSDMSTVTSDPCIQSAAPNCEASTEVKANSYANGPAHCQHER